MQKLKFIWSRIENLLFIGFAIAILYVTITSFFDGTISSIAGMGFLKDLTDPIQKKVYYQSVMALLSILTTFFLLVEMIRLFIHLNPLKNLGQKLSVIKSETRSKPFTTKLSIVSNRLGKVTFIKEFFRRYKSNFLAKVFNEYISKLIIIIVYIMDVTNFIDFYFGECISLYKDIKATKGLKNKLAMAFMPPGWSPTSREHTAIVVRQKFLEGQEQLGKTSRDQLLEKLKG